MKTYLVQIEAGCYSDYYTESYLVKANSPEEAFQNEKFNNFKDYWSPVVTVTDLDKTLSHIEAKGFMNLNDVDYEYVWRRKDG